ncbi:putative Aspartyl aminopeptidase [Paratrimastix pyriformis]|uniref:aspartyl aminopeptidase n=1 Tax=Paratrimastix pyriformis TaxID=342808 RepID=A0ABQ8UV87_9EUKA|nr:putative Aspartyl aminopeptidase [Paratrimastix pyriformis]
MTSAQKFIEFLRESPSAYHCVLASKKMLVQAGFQELEESQAWNLVPSGKYFFTRGASVMAFALGGALQAGGSFKIIGAHTDCPTLKIKPNSAVNRSNCLSVGVQTYGGGVWTTWFDRDLSVAGRAVVSTPEGRFQVRPVNVHRPILRIPNLAIHLDREASKTFNPQTHLLPMLASAIKGSPAQTGSHEFHHPLLMRLVAEELQVPVTSIVDVDLSLYDCQGPVVGGALNEFIFGQHLDNAIMAYCGLDAFVGSMGSLATEQGVRMCCCFDHEEVGSRSAEGAEATTLYTLMSRILRATPAVAAAEGLLDRCIARSMVISADVAHALHPNYSSCQMGAGPVIKFDTCQRYSTGLVNSFVLTQLAAQANVPVQRFMVRNDSPCGSTIGPAIASGCQISTADLGIPILSMHSIREQAALDDIEHTLKLFQQFYEGYDQLAASIEQRSA